MGIASNTLELIRSVFLRDNQFPQPPDFVAQYFGNYTNKGTAGPSAGPTTGYNTQITQALQIKNDIQSRYADYDSMAEYPEIATAVNIYADEATQADITKNQSVWIKSPDDTIQLILNNTLHKQLEIEDHIWEMAHDLTQFGNVFEEIVVRENTGVVKLINHPATLVRRIDDDQGILYGFIADKTNNFNLGTDKFLEMIKNPARNLDRSSPIQVFEPWEMAHFRIRASGRAEQYGVSAVDAARWAWKRLSWMEDAMVLYKLTRSASRYVFYIDVGDIPPNEARALLNKYKQDFKKQKYVDESGKMSFKWSPLGVDEDFFIARRKGERATEIETLSGLDGQQVDDAEYFKGKLIAALGIPRAYLGYDETIGRANLGAMDVRFAKSVMRIQRGLKSGIRHITQVDLAARNIDPDKVDYEVMMLVPSGALEVAHLEVLSTKADLAQKFQGLNFSEYYIQTKILGMSDDEVADEIEARLNEGGSSKAPDQSAGQSADQDPASEVPDVPKESIQRHIDKQRSLLNSKQSDQTNRILDMIESKDDSFSKRIKELRGLSYELKLALQQSRKR